MKRSRVTIDTSPAVLSLLDAALDLGLYGTTRAQVACRLLEGALRRELAEGLLGHRRPDLAPKPLKAGRGE